MDFVSAALGVVRGTLALANAVTKYLADKRLIEAGKAEAIADALQGAQKELRKVAANRTKFKSDPKYRDRLRKSFKRKSGS